ncbi:HisA/HisF family protein [Methanobacterium spitsbergense]|uniref:HisA/HisF family protein n=1 Tax=Methanobacterium spitsbergense TaxID=2874285 RepID=A0A8T5UXT9_9EURY|nr:HisA/HisF family protein [Methanobacterium spitsbergense]MBZ2165633.1 HisA/HisF family protein [Methanobacterium spitsbergense]
MIIPVLDLKKGEAVSGKSGMRETYKPLKTVFHDSSDPVAITQALKDEGYKRIYIADLDAINGSGSNLQIAGEINNILPVMLDSGVNSFKGIEKILDTVNKVIIATETIKSLDDLDVIFSQSLKQDLIMSVDVKNGHILGKYIKANFNEVLKKIQKIKPLEVILLDISRVGTVKGFDHALIDSFNVIDSELILGGGITAEDVKELNVLGIENFLVGTALHKGIINHY